MSEETLESLWQASPNYVTNLTKLIPVPNSKTAVEEIVKKASGGVFNNSAQSGINTFFWNSLSPRVAALRPAHSATRSTPSNGSFDKFKEEFTKVRDRTFVRAGRGS